MPEIILETDRLVLRTIAEGDYSVWIKYMNVPEVREYLGGVEEPHEIEAAFARMEASQATQGFSFWFAALKSCGTLIGSCGLKRLDAETAPESIKGEIEIGWILRPDYWGKGYASEAASASLDYAFHYLDAPRVIALTSESNIASWKMMEKIGMRRRPEYEFYDPAFPPRDNPTIVYIKEKPQ